jgi:hypothetical protein
MEPEAPCIRTSLQMRKIKHKLSAGKCASSNFNVSGITCYFIKHCLHSCIILTFVKIVVN